MAQRKIIKFGNTSHVLTIPNEWIRKNKLEKGDNLNLEEVDNSLLISLKKTSVKEKEVDINIDEVPLKIFNKKLISYYLKNYKYIKIKGEKVIERLEEIRIFKEKLSSIEIYEIGKDFILLKDLSDPEKLDVEHMISKIIEIEKILFDEIIETNRHNYISQIDSNINKLTFLTYKTINYNLENKISSDKVRNSIYYWRIVSSLETIGDIIKRVARYMEKAPDDQKHIFEIMIRSVKSYFEFITGLLKKGINLENNLKVYLDKKQSVLREFEEYRDRFSDNLNQYLVVVQLLKDAIGNLDIITLSIIDIYSN